MSTRSTHHGTFTIARVYDATPARVFKAFADAKAKQTWFGGPDEWSKGKYTLDFRVGGTERASGGPPGGLVHTYTATFHDIVPEERIVSTYEIYLDDTRISVSLNTTTLKPEGKGTRLTYTEQAVHLDGHDTVEGREQGSHELLDKLGRMLNSGAI